MGQEEGEGAVGGLVGAAGSEGAALDASWPFWQWAGAGPGAGVGEGVEGAEGAEGAPGEGTRVPGPLSLLLDCRPPFLGAWSACPASTIFSDTVRLLSLSLSLVMDM